MGYFTLVDNSGSYVGLGIPLLWQCGNRFMNGSGSKLRTPSTDDDWFGISMKTSLRVGAYPGMGIWWTQESSA